MPLRGYHLLKAALREARPAIATRSHPDPHFQLLLDDGAAPHRVAINVRSQLQPSELLVHIDDDFQHPMTATLAALAPGLLDLGVGGAPHPLALDVLRRPLFPLESLAALPAQVPGAALDLNQALSARLDVAAAHPGSMIYVWGEAWDEPTVRDRVFGFSHGRGVHDVHVNQGNVGRFIVDDGAHQDGALMIQVAASATRPARWIAVFLAFQSQAWRTDDAGHGLVTATLVAACLRPADGGPGQALVLNASPDPLDLGGHRLHLDDARTVIAPGTMVAPGAVVAVPLPRRATSAPLAPLDGSYLRLVDADGWRVDARTIGRDAVVRADWWLAL